MIRAALAAAALSVTAAPAFASQCMQLAQARGTTVHVAAHEALAPREVRILYVGHSAFRIETGDGAAAVTDFYGDPGPGPTPDAISMNHAHSTHWTSNPDPAIPNHLRGWSDDAGPARHWLQLGDLLVRNVPTDIRSWDGGWEKYGNSIFIFEYEGLCIGHLGHLHHQPTDEHYAQIGRLDVVLAPVDGGQTLEVPEMIEVLKRLRARVVIPMHYFSRGSLTRFLAGMADEFAVDPTPGSELVLSAIDLPDRPTIRILDPVRAGNVYGD